MKKVLSMAAFLLAVMQGWCYTNYDFSAAAPTGQTLYYKYSGNGVIVVAPIGHPSNYIPQYEWSNFEKPVGDLIIPNCVTYGGNTYTVRGIQKEAFLSCGGLTSVIISDSITYISKAAFKYCGITSVTIGRGVYSIEERAFDFCPNLTTVIFNADSCIFFGENDVFYNSVFTNCIQYIQNFIIGNNVKIIPKNLCRGMSISSITIPNSVISIGGGAFCSCYELSSVSIGYSVDSIGPDAFGYCTGLTTVTIPNSVTSINGAFSGCTGLTSVTIPNSVTSMDEAFSGCTGLTSVTIPNSVTSIDGAFSWCTGLTSVTIPNSVTRIDGAFSGCTGLTSVTIPNSVTSMEQAFSGCTGLTSVTIPNSVTSTFMAFSGCTGLTSVTIPNSMTCIDMYTFSGCTGLTSVTIPNSTTVIGQYAFYNCSSIASITSLASEPPSLGYMCFDGVNTQIPVYVPCESVAAYQSASGWSSFSNIQCNSAQIYTITATSGNPTMGTVTGGGSYADGATATLTAMPNSGYHFVRWQDNNTQNPRTITVTANATYTAYFEADGGDDDCPTITQFPWNATFDESLSCWKTVDADGDGYNWMNYQNYAVSESYSYFDGTNQGLTPDNWLISRRIQIPSSGTYTLSWTAQGMNTSYYNEHYSVYVSTTGDNPSNFSTQLFSETLNTSNAVNRSKSLDNYRGQTIRIAFRHHNTNDVFVLGIGNVKISQGTQGIEDIEGNGGHIYVEGQNIHISEIDGQDVTVYSIDGRVVASITNAAEQCSIPVPATGVYMVKIGNHPARKVVVMR